MYRSVDPSVAGVAALIGDPARASMLCALLDADELSAGVLARLGGVAANAATAHLNKLLAGGLILVRDSGRNRFYRLSSGEVAHALEALSVVASPPRIVALAQAQSAEQLRHARSCYDHLAGRLGVAVTEALVRHGIILPAARREYDLTTRGNRFFASLGVDVEGARQTRRHFARQCLDWSERRPHLAGALGAALRDAFLAKDWVAMRPATRALRVTDGGRSALKSLLAIDA